MVLIQQMSGIYSNKDLATRLCHPLSHIIQGLSFRMINYVMQEMPEKERTEKQTVDFQLLANSGMSVEAFKLPCKKTLKVSRKY